MDVKHTLQYPDRERFIDAAFFFGDIEHDEFVGMFNDGHLEIRCDGELLEKWPVANEEEAFELFKKVSIDFLNNFEENNEWKIRNVS